jgi:hypothetical protein
VLDYNADASLVGIDIDLASRKYDLTTLTMPRLPSVVHTEAA